MYQFDLELLIVTYKSRKPAGFVELRIQNAQQMKWLHKVPFK